MSYTISEIARKLNIAPSAIRYYDKEGLIPGVKRTSGGMRAFTESDLSWLKLISCLKRAGMSIKDIRQYVEYAQKGDETIDARLKLIHNQRALLLKQMQELQDTLDVVDYKCWYYETAKAAGTADGITEDAIPEKFRAVAKRLRGE